MYLAILLATLAVLLTLVYIKRRYNESYWQKRGVKYHPQNKIIGPTWDYVTGKRPFFEIYGDLYKQYRDEPAVGVGGLFSPALFIPNAENCSHILQNDFNSFSHRGLENFEGDQLSETIIFLNGQKWKLMRQVMSPLFTSSKLKQMYYIMDKSAQDFVAFLKADVKKQQGKAYDTLNLFCSAAISASVFGIGTGSVFDSPFVKMARAAIEPTFATNIKFSIQSNSARLTRFLRLKLFSKFEPFFVGAIKHVLSERSMENVKRHDFVDLALSIQKNGMIRDPTTGFEMEPTVGLLSAQAFFFFIAGVEPSATTLFCTLFELGVNPDILKKVHDEIDEAFEKHNGNITYDVLTELNYLEKVLSEALRKYPPIGHLTRQCTQDTVLPVGNIKVSKGTKLVTPIFNIHRDPEYYPDPMKFDPERFTKGGQQQLADAFYMPFGRGSRICIGARLARIQVKAGLIHLLRHFTVKTVNFDNLEFQKEPFSVRPLNVDVLFTPRNI